MADDFDPDAYLAGGGGSADSTATTQDASGFDPDAYLAPWYKKPSPAFLQPFETAVKHNVQPFLEHPVQAAVSMIVPTKEDVKAVAKVFTNPREAFRRDAPVGSQAWWDQLVGYGAPLLLGAAGKAFKGPEVAARPAAAPEAPAVRAEPVGLEQVIETTFDPDAYLAVKGEPATPPKAAAAAPAEAAAFNPDEYLGAKAAAPEAPAASPDVQTVAAAPEATAAPPEAAAPEVQMVKLRDREGNPLSIEGGEPNASQITSPEGIPLQPLRSEVGGETPLQQPRETPQTIAQPEAELPQGQSQAAARLTRAAAPDGGYSENPLVRFVIDDAGGLLSRSAAKAKLGSAKYEGIKSLWDSAPEFPDPRHNKIYNARSGQMPDSVASAAAEAGLLPPDADASTLFNALQKAGDAAHSMARQERAQRGVNTQALKLDRQIARLEKSEGSKKQLGQLRKERESLVVAEEAPKLRPGEKGTGDLFQAEDQPFNLAGETGIDHEARQRAIEAAKQAQTEAAAKTDAEQMRLLEPVPKYVDKLGLSAAQSEEAIDGISRTLSLATDPRLAESYEGKQGELFHGERTAVAPEPAQAPRKISAGEASRAGFLGLAARDVGKVSQAFAAGKNRISILLHELVSGQRPAWNIVGARVETPADFAMLMQSIRSPYFETLKVAVLDRTNRVVAAEIVGQGTLNEAIAHPRDMLRVLGKLKEKYKETRIIISHNHPSGDPTPSQADMGTHRRWEEAAVTAGSQIIDHVITNGKTFYSFRGYGIEDLPTQFKQPWELERQTEMPKIDSPTALSAFVGTLRASDPNSAHIVYVGTRYNLIAIERIPAPNAMLLNQALAKGVGREGAYAVLVDLPEIERPAAPMIGEHSGDAGQRILLSRLGETTKLLDVKLLDASWPGMESAKEAGLVGEQPATYAAGPDIPSQRAMEEAANDPEKMRGHIATIQRMVDVSPDVKQRVESWYTPTNLESVRATADATINKLGLGKATDQFMRSRTADADTLALGHQVALRLDKLGRFDEAEMVRDAMAERATGPAQALWFISTIEKTSPEGLIRQAQKIVTDQIRNDPEKMALLDQINQLRSKLAGIADDKTRGAMTEITVRNLARVNKPGQRLSQAQLENLLTKHAAGELTPDDLAAALAKYLKIPRVTPDNIIKIKRAQELYASTDDPIMKLRRGAEMMDSVYGLVDRGFWAKVRAAATISMIMHGRLPIRIGASNMLQMAGQTLVDSVNAVTLDPLVSIVTGKRAVPGPELKARISGLGAPIEAFRAGAADARVRGLGLVPTFKEGVRTMLDMATMTTRQMFEIQDMNGRGIHTFSSRLGQLAEDTVTLVHNVVPYSFWNAAHRASLARQMRLVGADVPTADMITNARLDANKAIFQNETAVYHMMRGVRRILDYPTAKITKGQYGLGTATIPFAKVPGAILTEGATWTPLGFVRAGWEAFRPLFTSETFRQKDFVDAFTKATVGTGALVATGYWLGKLGIISSAPDDNKNVEAMRRSTGFGQYRVNFSELKRRFLSGNFTTPMREPFGQDGDVTYNYNWLEPIAFPLAMGADIAHSVDKREIDLKHGKITTNAAVTAAAAGVQTLTTHPMLQNIERMQTTLADQGWIPAGLGTLANVPGNFIPSLVRQTAQYVDNTVRETRGGDLIAQDVHRLAVQIPWLSQRYPARFDVFGQAVQRYNYGENSLLNIYFNPSQPDRLLKNPNVNELMRLYNATGETKGFPSQVQHRITINGKQVELDNLQLATYQRYVGQLSSAGITRLLASPEFAAEPLPVKQSLLTQVLEAVHEAARIDLFGQKQYSVGSRGSVRIASPYSFRQMQLGRQAGLTQPANP